MASSEQVGHSGLILNTGAIGDCLLSLPLAEAMRAAYRLDRVDFVGNTEYIGFYPGRTCIDGVRSAESVPLYRLFADENEFVLEDKDRLQDMFSGYAHVVSFLGTGHPHFEQNLLFSLHSTHSAQLTMIPALAPPEQSGHIIDFYCNTFQDQNQLENIDVHREQIVCPLSADYLAGRDCLKQASMDPDASLVVMQPGSGSTAKNWHSENFLQVAGILKQENYQVLFLLGPAETERMSQQQIARFRGCGTVLENLSLTHVLQVLTQADLFLGNDSGIGHLSAMMGRKTVILFGPTNLNRYRPLGPSVYTLTPTAKSFHETIETEWEAVAGTLLELL